MGYFLAFVAFVGSMFAVDYLASERGWNRHRWRVTAATIGPLAIPLIYVLQAVHAIGKIIYAPRR